MCEITLTLPEDLARKAQDSGLLRPESIAALLRAELRRRYINKLFAAADRLANVDSPISEADVALEVELIRQAHRSS